MSEHIHRVPLCPQPLQPPWWHPGLHSSLAKGRGSARGEEQGRDLQPGSLCVLAGRAAGELGRASRGKRLWGKGIFSALCAQTVRPHQWQQGSTAFSSWGCLPPELFWRGQARTIFLTFPCCCKRRGCCTPWRLQDKNNSFFFPTQS